MGDAWTRQAHSLDTGADRILARLLDSTLISVSVVAALGVFLLLDGRRRLVGMRRTELGLSSANIELDRRVAERTRELAAALDSARSELVMRKQAEKALGESEKQLRLLTDATSSAVYWMSPDWKEMRRQSGDGFVAGVGKADDGWLEKLIPDAERDRVLSAIRAAVETKSVFQLEYRVIRQDGGAGWVLSSAVPMLDDSGDIVEWFGAETDVTARKQAEESLRASERRLRRFYDSGIMGVLYWNMDGEVTDANDRFLEIVGYTREDLEAGRIDWRSMTPPEFRNLDEAVLSALRSGSANAAPFEKQYVRKNGERVAILVAAAMLDERRFDGVAFVLDITERKRAEAALRASEKRLRLLIEASSSVVYRMNSDWTEMRQLTGGGFLTETVDRLWFQTLIPADDRARVAAAIQRAIDARSAFELEHRIIRPDGSVGWQLARAVPMVDDSGEILEWFGAATDITGVLSATIVPQQALPAELVATTG